MQRILITAGPTREPLDPVRYLSNHSSGKQGYAIAEACVAQGFEVVLISGEVAMPAPKGVQLVRVQTAEQMLAACEAALPVDVAICTAAVCDWRPEAVLPQKMKKQQGQESLTLTFVKNPDILAHIANHAKRPALVVGFAAETEHHLEHARKKLASKGCDAIVLNDVSPESNTFGGDENHLQLLMRGALEVIDFGKCSKHEAANQLIKHLIALEKG